MCVSDGLVSHEASEWKAELICTCAIRVRLFHRLSYREETMSSSADSHRVMFQSIVARVAAAAAACASE
jgi:hypothetical protein